MESAGIPDLAAKDLVRLRGSVKSDSRAADGTAEDRRGVAAERVSSLVKVVRHDERVEVAPPTTVSTSVSISSRIMMIYSKEFVSVNNTGSKRTSASLLVYMYEDGFFICERDHVGLRVLSMR